MMADMAQNGHCLCGEVTVRVDGPMAEMSACHCELCTRWSGSVHMGIDLAAKDVTFAGLVKTHRSSRLATRAWCDTCGSALYLQDAVDTDRIEVFPGLFDNAGGATLVRVVYADCHPDGFSLAGDISRVSKQEYEAAYPHLSEGTNE
jgi:hypothetical protein